MFTRILPLLSLFVLAAPVFSDGKEKYMVEKLQGNWAFESVEINGKLDVSEKILGQRVVFQNDQVVWMDKPGGRKESCPFKIDASSCPFKIDLNFSAEFPTRGIVALRNDRLVICFSKFSVDRPTEFSSMKPGHILAVLTRVK